MLGREDESKATINIDYNNKQKVTLIASEMFHMGIYMYMYMYECMYVCMYICNPKLNL